MTVEKYATGEKDFSSLITKMRSIDPDCLVVMDQGDSVAAIFNQADAAGWDIQHVALGPGTSEQLISQLTTPDNLIVTSPFFFDENDEELSSWAKWFEEEAGFAPTIHPACAYDCVYLIANAVEKLVTAKLHVMQSSRLWLRARTRVLQEPLTLHRTAISSVSI